jgi:glycosyltransferase involved in cell wall biosynthesis
MIRFVRRRWDALWQWVRDLTAQARGHFPGASGVEMIVLAFILGMLPFQLRILRALSAQGPRWRRLVGTRRLHHPAKKILHVTASFDLGGTQTQIRNLCEHSTDQWFEHLTVEVFPEHNFLYRRETAVEPERYGGDSAVGRALQRTVAHIGVRSAQIVQVYKFVRDFKALRPDVVIGWGHEMSMLTYIAGAIARVPHIVFCIRTFNPSYGWCSPEMGAIYHTAHRRMALSLSGIIVNSTVLQKDYAEWLGIDPPRITPCPNGIDPHVLDAEERARQRSQIRQRFAIPEDALLIVNVGRFSAEKGQFTILAANEILMSRFPAGGFWWLLCGDGVLLPEAKARAEASGADNVVFAGRTNEVPAVLAAADVFVMASDFEGMPNAMMEAMAAGLASVSTNRTGALDIARDGIEALYCNAGAADELADHLSTLIADPSERCRLAAAAATRMHEFTIDKMTSRYNAILHRITGAPTGPAIAVESRAPAAH